MAKNLLDRAEKLYRRKKYADVISLLEPVILEIAPDDVLAVYRHTFELYFFLGMSCLYTGDTGGAFSFLERAGKLKPGNTDIILARAVTAVIQGKRQDACTYYLDVLRRSPSNKKATKALKFLRKADEETLRNFVVEKKIFRFCPKLKPKKKKKGALIAAAAIICVCAAGGILYFTRPPEVQVARADLSEFALSVDERQGAVEQEGSFTYVLTSKQVVSSFDLIKTYFNEFRDNAAQVEINRLLNSNASAAIRRKARLLMDYLSEPGFDTIKDVYTYSQVAAEPILYTDCWVVWDGMAANIARGEESTDFNFLVGYDRNTDLQGIVQVHFDRALSFDQDRPFSLLGQIKSEGGKVVLRGSAIFQTVRPAATAQGG